MKKLLILATGLFLSQWGFSQSVASPQSRKNSLAITAGPAFPVGDFGKTDTEGAGAAKTGININLQYTRHLGRIGVIAQGFWSSHGVKNIPIGIDGLTYSMDHWQYAGLLAGVSAETPINKSRKFFFNAKAMLGPVMANGPVITISAIVAPGETVPQTVKTEDNWAATLGMGVGLGLKYQFRPATYVQFGADYLYLDPTLQAKSAAVGYSEEYHQRINVINLHLGLGFNF